METIGNLVQTHQNFLILSHEEPEGDCLGSSLALGRSLTLLGKRVWLYNVHGVPYTCQFLEGWEQISTSLPPWRPDLVFVLDCGSFERVGREALAFVQGLPLINIDHHLSNSGFGTVAVVDPRASSTGELIFSLLKSQQWPMDIPIWEAILCAVVTDTGSFRYQNSTPLAFQIGGEALQAGARPWVVAEGLFERNPPQRLKALARALDGLEVAPHGRWCLMPISTQLLAETGATRQDLDGFINYARSMDGVEVAILVREDNPDLQKISLRSRGRINVSAIATALGGGGHHNAAACKIPGNMAHARTILIDKVENALQEKGLA